MNIIKKIHRHGLRKSFRIASDLIKKKSGFTRWRLRNAPVFTNPVPTELVILERDLHALLVMRTSQQVRIWHQYILPLHPGN